MNASMFSFDPSQYHTNFADQGYLHIRDGVSPEFHDALSEEVERYLSANTMAVLDKRQALYTFPADRDYLTDLCQAVGAIVGIDPSRLVLSERHIKAYSADAEAYPPAHKDRYASEISLGIAIHVPKDSRLVLYPNTLSRFNPFNSAVRMRARIGDEELFQSSPAALRGSLNVSHELLATPGGSKNLGCGTREEQPVEIADSTRDVVIFRGHSTWHRRIHSAGTRMLYLKLNSFNSDPLGEDPRTPQYRERTLNLLSVNDEELLGLVPSIGRLVDYFHLYFTHTWQEVGSAVFWGEKHFELSREELKLVQSIDGTRLLAHACMTASIQACPKCLRGIRQLAEHGVIDLSTSTA